MTGTVSPGLDHDPAFAIQLKQSGKGNRGKAGTEVDWTRVTPLIFTVNRLNNSTKVNPAHSHSAAAGP